MKIIYKKPILEQINTAVNDAKKRGVEIDHIHLSKKEADELRKACGVNHIGDKSWNYGSVMGVEFVIDDEIGDIYKELVDSIFGNRKPGGEAGCDKEKKKV